MLKQLCLVLIICSMRVVNGSDNIQIYKKLTETLPANITATFFESASKEEIQQLRDHFNQGNNLPLKLEALF